MRAACCSVSIPTQHHALVTGASEASGYTPGVTEASEATCTWFSCTLVRIIHEAVQPRVDCAKQRVTDL